MERIYDVTIPCACPFCNKIRIVAVNSGDYRRWASGEALAQVAFPYLSVDDREALISGICSDCWDEMFSDEEEE